MSDVLVSREGRILELALNRPARKNALSLAMYQTLAEALEGAAKDDAVRVILLRGEGGVFTSGNDLGDFMKAPPTGEDAPVFRFLQALTALDKPLVAAVDGPAVGVGTTMLLHADLVYAAETARFSLPFVNLALVPEAASSYLLPKLCGYHRAAELLMLGETFDAQTARTLGLVNAVLPPAEVLAHARQRAAQLSERAPEALRATKRLLRAPIEAEVAQRMRAEAAIFVERLASPEVAEAISAFFEKRPPRFA